MISFAQNFEDVLLERLFQGKRRGFYVDVGAWDPTQYSVTRHFYQRGWRGVNVEPIPRRHALFVAQRQRDINLCGLVGAVPATRTFYECVDKDYLSTTVDEVASALRAAGDEMLAYPVAVERLDAIFERHCPNTVDFLKLDVEGAEAEVLASIDLRRHRPRALVIEATRPGSGLQSWDEPEANGTWQEWEEGVLAAGYVFALFDGLNRFYLRHEDRRLAGRLKLPPGVFDGIDCSSSPQAEAAARLEVIERQQAEMISARDHYEAALSVARTELATLEADRVARGGVIEGLRAQLDEADAALATSIAERGAQDARHREQAAALNAAEADRALRLDAIDRLAAEAEERERRLVELGEASTARAAALEADRVARGAVIEGLQRQLAELEADRALRLDAMERLGAELEERGRQLVELGEASTARAEALEADRVARGVIMEALQGQLEALAADRAARDVMIDGLRRQLAELAADRALRLEEIERLAAELEAGQRRLAELGAASAARAEALEADRVARGVIMEALQRQLEELAADRALRLDTIARLTADVASGRQQLAELAEASAARAAALDADRIARDAVIAGLRDQLAALDAGWTERGFLIDARDRALAGAREDAARRAEAADRQAAALASGVAETRMLGDRVASLERLAGHRHDLAAAQQAQIAMLETELVAASSELATLRRRWLTRIETAISGRR